MEKFQQISQDILRLMELGHFFSGEKLPSINQISNQYGCSRGTAIRAYQHLKEKQVVYVKNKSGYYSCFVPKEKHHSSGYHLESGNPTVGSFYMPYAKQSLLLALEKHQAESLDADASGVPAVIEELIKTLSTIGIYTSKKKIFLSMGVQQNVYILQQMNFPNKKKNILLEEPTYRFVVDIFANENNGEIYTIKRTVNGFDLKELEHIFKTKDIKFFYLVPRNHNPLGTTLDIEQRKKIVSLSQKYDVVLAEDDYFLDANYIPNYSTLHYLSSGENCVFLGSFTKILPYLRIGFVIMPTKLQPAYYEAVEKVMKTNYYTPPLISQSMLGVLIQNNFFEKSKKMINEELKNKIKIIKTITSQWDKNIAKYTGYDGYYSTIMFNEHFSVGKLIEQLKKKKIFVVSNYGNYFFKKNYEQSIRISLAKMSKTEIIEVFPIIYLEIKKIYEELST